MREYRTFQEFLRRIEAGAPPSSSQQGDQRYAFRQKEGQFYATIEKMYGLIGQAELELSLVGDNEAGNAQRVSRLIDDLTNAVFGYGVEVIYQVVPNQDSNRFRLWHRIGDPIARDFDIDNNLKSPGTIIYELDSGLSKFLQADITRTANIPELEKRLEEVLQAARLQLSIDRQLTIIPDPKTALISWIRRDRQGYTPEQVASQFIEYFKGLEKDWIENPD